MRKEKNIFANIDLVSILLYLILIVFGWINIYASQYNEDTSLILDLSSRYGKQFLFIIISSLIALVILIIDWKFFFSLSYIFYFITLLLLIGVLFIGNKTAGAISWYEFNGFKFQPSELAKFCTGLAVAKYYNSIHSKKISKQNKINRGLIHTIIIII